MPRSALIASSLLAGVAVVTAGAVPAGAVNATTVDATVPTAVASAVTAEAAPTRGILAAYTLVAPKLVASSQLVARVVLPRGAGCPNLRVRVGSSTRRLPMTPRMPGLGAMPAFGAVQVCDRAIPTGAGRASVLGRRIPAALPAHVERIVLTGDTGCRIKGSAVQNCNEPTEWPLATISERIAREDPDLVINLGDFLYRESACAPQLADLCGGSPAPLPGFPFVDSAYSWLADALVPMAPLLPVAPIVMLRGNHETCERGGNGFFLLFDPRPDTAATCDPRPGPNGLTVPANAVTPTWAATIPVGSGRSGRNLRLAVVDSAYGADSEVSIWAGAQRAGYVQAAAATTPRAGRESWLLTHKPVFSYVSTEYAALNPPGWTVWTSLDQTAASQGLLDNYSLIAASHNHLFQAVQIPGAPPSIVVGNGGTKLDPASGYPVPTYGPLATTAGTPLVSSLTPYPAPSFGWTAVEFGYVLATPRAGSGRWSMQVDDPAGHTIGACRLASRTIGCQ